MAIDKKNVREFVKGVLKHGTPRWLSHPRDYTSMVNEWIAKVKQDLRDECDAYRSNEQDELSDPRGRRVNMMAAAVFMRKLRTEGKLTCYSHDSQLKDGSASLFVLLPTQDGGVFVPQASLQVPLMWEWTTMRIDPNTGLAMGYRDIGWRSAVCSLIRNGALTEERAHQIFGKPREFSGSRFYRATLFESRNGGKRNAA